MFDRNAYYRNYWKTHPEQYEKLKATVKRNKKEHRAKIIVLLGSKCSKCGFSDVRALDIDHINSNGTQERKQYKRDSYYLHILKAIRSGSKDYQLLCCNCNRIKMFENNEWKN